MHLHRSRWRAAALVPASIVLIPALAPRALANHGPGTSGGGSSTASGETLKQGRFDLSLRTDFTQFDSFTRAEAGQKAIVNGECDSLDRALVQSASLSYGITDDFQVGAQIGYYWGDNFVSAEDDGAGGAEIATADPRGLTDLWLQAKYRVMHGAAGHLALIGGVKLPTGDDDEKLSNGERLEPSSQPGTGAVDFQLGAAYSRYLTSRITLDASTIYTLRGEHDDFQVGDRFDAGLALAWRATESVQTFPNLSLSAEVFGVWLDKDQDDGTDNDQTGGTTIYFSPGVRERFNDKLAVSLAPAFPIYQDQNGDQVESDYKLSATVSIAL